MPQQPTCIKCGVDLIPAPNHPGCELGDWWTHPAESMGISHTSAFMRRHPQLAISTTKEA